MNFYKPLPLMFTMIKSDNLINHVVVYIPCFTALTQLLKVQH